jgi:plasmid stability protein
LYSEMAMPTLTIRNLPDHVHAALRNQALQDGLSVEAEVRKILTDACMMDRKPTASLQQLVDQLYHGEKPANVVEHLLQERRQEAEKK